MSEKMTTFKEALLEWKYGFSVNVTPWDKERPNDVRVDITIPGNRAIKELIDLGLSEGIPIKQVRQAILADTPKPS